MIDKFRISIIAENGAATTIGFARSVEVAASVTHNYIDRMRSMGCPHELNIAYYDDANDQMFANYIFPKETKIVEEKVNWKKEGF